MTSLNFTDIAEVGSKGRDGGSFLVQVSGVGVAINAIVYSGILNEDVDGDPNVTVVSQPMRGSTTWSMPRIWSVAEFSTGCLKA